MSLLLCVCKHIHAIGVTKLAHVADLSERKVVVEASLTGPITYTLCWSLRGTLSLRVEGNRAVLVVALGCDSLHDLLLHDLGLFLVYLLLWLEHVLRFAFDVLNALGLLASVALLSALEVVVLALVTFPAAIWEFEAASFGILTKTFVVFVISIILVEGLCGLPEVEAWLRMELCRSLVIVNDNVVDSLWDILLLGLIYLLLLLLGVEWLRAKDSRCTENR